MKNIKPITIRNNGETIKANRLSVSIVGDNLSDSMTTYWEVSSVTENKEGTTWQNIMIQNWNVTIANEDYKNLDTANGIDINEEIYRYVANSLNLTLE